MNLKRVYHKFSRCRATLMYIIFHMLSTFLYTLQVSVLPHALHAFAESCDNLVELEDVITRIVNRHVNSGVQHWHYPLLEECFIGALK